MQRDWNTKYMSNANVGDRDLQSVQQAGRREIDKDNIAQRRMERGQWGAAFPMSEGPAVERERANRAGATLRMYYANGQATSARGDELDRY